jgi:hypothetical protein
VIAHEVQVAEPQSAQSADPKTTVVEPRHDHDVAGSVQDARLVELFDVFVGQETGSARRFPRRERVPFNDVPAPSSTRLLAGRTQIAVQLSQRARGGR